MSVYMYINKFMLASIRKHIFVRRIIELVKSFKNGVLQLPNACVTHTINYSNISATQEGLIWCFWMGS